MPIDVGTAFLNIEAKLDRVLAQTSAMFGGPQMAEIGKKAGVLIGAGIAAGLSDAAFIKVGEQVERAFDTLRVKTGETGVALGKLNQDFEDVARNAPQSLGETADAMATLHARLDVGQGTVKDLTVQVENLARITGSDLNETVKSSAGFFNNWHISASQMSTSLDFVFKASQATGVGVNQLMDQVRLAGPQFRAMGVSMEDSVLLTAQMQKAGVEARPVLLALNRAIGDMAKSGLDPKQAIAGLIEEVKNAPDPIEALRVAVENFGIRGGVRFEDFARKGGFSLDEIRKKVTENTDTINAEGEKTKHFTDRVKELGNAIALDLGPTAGKAVDGLAAAFKGLHDFADTSAGSVVVPFVAIAAAAGPTLVVVSKIASGLASIASAAVDAAGTAISAVSRLGSSLAQAATSGEGLLSTVGKFAGGAAALGVMAAGAYAIVSSFQDASRAADEMLGKFKVNEFDSHAERAKKLNAELEKLNQLQREDSSRSWLDAMGGAAAGLLHLSDDTQAATMSQQALNESIKRAQADIANGQKDLNAYDKAVKAVSMSLGISTDDVEKYAKQLQLDPATTSAEELATAIQKLRQESGTAATDGVDPLTRKMQELEGAMMGAKDAQVSYQKALQGITDAQHAYTQAVERVADAEHARVKAVEAITDAERANQKALERIEDAQVSYEKSLERIQDAEVAYGDSVQKVRDAVDKVREAEQALAEARNNNEKYALSAAEADLKLSEAKLKQRDAEYALRKALADGTGQDVEKARLDAQKASIDVQQAEIAAKKAHGQQAEDVAKATKDLEKAQRDLIAAQRDEVKAAEAIRDAQREARKAAEGVRDAQYEATKAAKAVTEAHYSAKKAADAVTQAQWEAKKAGDAIRDAQDGAAKAAQNLAKKLDEQTKAIRDDKDQAGLLLDHLKEMQERYPAVAAALQPYIDQLALMAFYTAIANGQTPAQPPWAASPGTSDARPPAGQPGHARGGFMSPGEVSEVNEAGVELWERGGKTFALATKDGKVIPADQAGGGGRAVQVTQVNHFRNDLPSEVAIEYANRKLASEMSLLAG